MPLHTDPEGFLCGPLLRVQMERCWDAGGWWNRVCVFKEVVEQEDFLLKSSLKLSVLVTGGPDRVKQAYVS